MRRSRPTLSSAFPARRDDDFERTLEYVRSGVFANAFTFMYSIRRGTPAAHWEQVPRDVASARFARLIDAQNAVTRAYHDRQDRHVVRALIAGRPRKTTDKLAAKALDNVTVIAPKPDDYDESSTHASRGSTSRSKRRTCGVAPGRSCGARGGTRRPALPSSDTP